MFYVGGTKAESRTVHQINVNTTESNKKPLKFFKVAVVLVVSKSSIDHVFELSSQVIETETLVLKVVFVVVSSSSK